MPFPLAFGMSPCRFRFVGGDFLDPWNSIKMRDNIEEYNSSNKSRIRFRRCLVPPSRWRWGDYGPFEALCIWCSHCGHSPAPICKIQYCPRRMDQRGSVCPPSWFLQMVAFERPVPEFIVWDLRPWRQLLRSWGRVQMFAYFQLLWMRFRCRPFVRSPSSHPNRSAASLYKLFSLTSNLFCGFTWEVCCHRLCDWGFPLKWCSNCSMMSVSSLDHSYSCRLPALAWISWLWHSGHWA
jgi:hypothetical protein